MPRPSRPHRPRECESLSSGGLTLVEDELEDQAPGRRGEVADGIASRPMIDSRAAGARELRSEGSEFAGDALREDPETCGELLIEVPGFPTVARDRVLHGA